MGRSDWQKGREGDPTAAMVVAGGVALTLTSYDSDSNSIFGSSRIRALRFGSEAFTGTPLKKFVITHKLLKIDCTQVPLF